MSEPPNPLDHRHHPLPYRVRVRLSAQDDAVPDVRAFEGMLAYSPMEALTQAVAISLGYGAYPNTPSVAVEHLGPDLEAYYRLLDEQQRIVAKLKASAPSSGG